MTSTIVNKLNFEFRIGTPLSISAIAQRLEGIGAQAVQSLLETALVEHYQQFGQQPYSIAYDRTLGYVVQAGPVIGQIDCGPFILSVKPKFPGLELGKCLQLAHHCNFGKIGKHTNSVIEDSVSNNEHLKGIDYFASVFISAVTDVVNNGLLRTHAIVEKPDPQIRGNIKISKHISAGTTHFAPYMSRFVATTNVPANRAIKSALELCRIYSSSKPLQALAVKSLDAFRDATALSPGEKLDYRCSSSIRRADYELALTVAKIILEGFDPNKGADIGFLPSFTLNLDQLFEAFVKHELKRCLKKDFYKVLAQPELPHPIRPVFKNKKIVPDIIVHSTSEPSKLIILDTKNKYSLADNDIELSISNTDLYQIAYYCMAQGSSVAILAYPGNNKTKTKYPLKSAEGEATYETKRLRALESLRNSPQTFLEIVFDEKTIQLFVWRINLEDTIQDTLASIAELSLFISDAIKGRI